MRSSRFAVALFLTVIAGSGAAPQETSPPLIPPQAPSTPPPLSTGPAPDLDLMFTSQVIGYIEPCG
jgi:hypothetical protein